jgi:hypothetical protein
MDTHPQTMDKYGTANHPHLEPLHRTTKFDMSIKPQVCPVVFTNLAIPFTGASYIYYPPQLFILAELLGGASLLVNSLYMEYPHIHMAYMYKYIYMRIITTDPICGTCKSWRCVVKVSAYLSGAGLLCWCFYDLRQQLQRQRAELWKQVERRWGMLWLYDVIDVYICTVFHT